MGILSDGFFKVVQNSGNEPNYSLFAQPTCPRADFIKIPRWPSQSAEFMEPSVEWHEADYYLAEPFASVMTVDVEASAVEDDQD